MTSAGSPVHLLGVPFNSAGRIDGVARAPQALRAAGMAVALAGIIPEFTDRGDVRLARPTPQRDPHSHVIAPAALAAMISAVRVEVEEVLAARAFPLVLGGDCPILLGGLAAARGADPSCGLLFVDGHEDAWPPAASTTGEAADMELGFALGLTVQGLPADVARVMPRLDSDRVLVIGPRDEQELADSGVASIRERVEVMGPRTVAEQEGDVHAALDRLSQHGPWWFHVDLDVLSTASLGAVDYRLPGGLTWDELQRLTVRALRTPGVIGWDVTIYNPDLDTEGTGAGRIVRYLQDSLRDARR